MDCTSSSDMENCSYLLLGRGGLHPFSPLLAGDLRLLLRRGGWLPFEVFATGRPNIKRNPHCGRVHVGDGVGVGVNEDHLARGDELPARVARLGPGDTDAPPACHGRRCGCCCRRRRLRRRRRLSHEWGLMGGEMAVCGRVGGVED